MSTEHTPRRWLHLLLFGLTLASTLYVGLLQAEGFYWSDELWTPGATPIAALITGMSYAVSIMAILLAHELGHYLTALRYGVDATPPFFIPFPSLFGTLGAFIRMRLERRVAGDGFMRVAAYGPIWGFAVAVPVVFIGVALSRVGPAVADVDTAFVLGEPPLMMIAQAIFQPDVQPGYDVWLHPMAFAGWAGLFVTALNLFPVGQLDGGHISYALLGDIHNRLAPLFFAAFVGLTAVVWSGWALMCVFVLLMGVRHPPICTGLPVTGQSRWVGLLAVVLFVLSFTPVPVEGLPTLIDLVAP